MRLPCLILSLAGPLSLPGCGEATYYPEAGMPAYGEGGEWDQCSAAQLGGGLAGQSTLAVENTLTEPVDLIWVDTGCIEQLVAELAPGERYEFQAEHGYVFAVRGLENGFLYAHFQWLGPSESDSPVVIP